MVLISGAGGSGKAIASILGPVGFWLGQLLALVAIGTGVSAFIGVGPGKPGLRALAIAGILAGALVVLFDIWIVGLSASNTSS